MASFPGESRDRSLRSRRERLHPLDGAQPPLSRPHHAADDQGRTHVGPSPIHPRPARGAGDPLYGHGGQCPEGGAARAQGHGSLSAEQPRGAGVRRHRDRRVVKGDLGAHLRPTDRRPRRKGRGQSGRRRPSAGPAGPHGSGAGLYRLRAQWRVEAVPGAGWRAGEACGGDHLPLEEREVRGRRRPSPWRFRAAILGLGPRPTRSLFVTRAPPVAEGSRGRAPHPGMEKEDSPGASPDRRFLLVRG